MSANGNGRIAWLQLALTGLVVGGGLWSFAIAPIKSDVNRALSQGEDALRLATNNKSSLDTTIAQNATSIKDRDELNKKAAIAEEKISQMESLVSQNEERSSQKLAEVETQFDALAQSANTFLANQHQKNADFQNALSGLDAKIPPSPNLPLFFPNISNRGKK